jgi:hypothetical protein
MRSRERFRNTVTKEKDMIHSTKSIAMLALTIGVIGSLVSPVLAASATRYDTYGAYARETQTRQRSANSRPVYDINGHYVGTDPDPFIRDMLAHDPGEAGGR